MKKTLVIAAKLGFSIHYVCTHIGSIGVVKNWAADPIPIGQLGKWVAINKTSPIRTTFI